MGKLSIHGSAQRDVRYDAIDLRINFHTQAKKTSDAVNMVMEQCEQLLRLVTDVGVDMKNIHIGTNSVDRDYNHDKLISVNQGVIVSANRGITLRLNFDMPFVNRLMDMIHKEDFSIDMECHYVLTNRDTIHAELLKEAVADSKRKAEAIAEITGQNVIGIDSMNLSSYDHEDMDYLMDSYRFFDEMKPLLSDQLQAPITTQSESVSIVWLIE